MPYLLLAVLVLGTGLGIGLGLSEAPVQRVAAAPLAVHRAKPQTLGARVLAVTVSPNTGLTNGQSVTISVSGFPPGKAYLSECAYPVAANPLGCGAQLALQPFIVIENGTGSTTFVVNDTNVPDAPYSPETVNQSSHVVLVITDGEYGGDARGEVTIPLSFADPLYSNPATAQGVGT